MRCFTSFNANNAMAIKRIVTKKFSTLANIITFCIFHKCEYSGTYNEISIAILVIKFDCLICMLSTCKLIVPCYIFPMLGKY